MKIQDKEIWDLANAIKNKELKAEVKAVLNEAEQKTSASSIPKFKTVWEILKEDKNGETNS